MTANTAGKNRTSGKSTGKRKTTCSRAPVAGSTGTLRLTMLAPGAPWYTKEQLEAKPQPKPRPPPKPKPQPKPELAPLQPKPKKTWGDGLNFYTWTKPKLKL